MKTWQKLAATAAIWVVGQLVAFYLFWLYHGYVGPSETLSATCFAATYASAMISLFTVWSD